jgi:hypothetical protein
MATVTRPYASSLAWLLLGLLHSCGPPLYFATHQAQQITRLEQAGDVQLQVSGQLDLGIQQLYQAEAEVAVGRYLAVRGGLLRGTDNLALNNDIAVNAAARQMGLGGFYALPFPNVRGASWLGYANGSISNVNNAVFSGLFVPSSEIETFNRYERLFVEQQLRYTLQGVDFFGSLTLGTSQIYDLRYVSTVTEGSSYDFQLKRQESQPFAPFGIVGFGISGGSPNLRVHLRIDQWFGRGAFQISAVYPTFISTGFSWRLQPFK